jgi:hypothetical protein
VHLAEVLQMALAGARDGKAATREAPAAVDAGGTARASASVRF